MSIVRRYGWTGSRPRDWTKPRYTIGAPAAVDHVDPLTSAIPIRDQGQEGACTGFGSARGFQYALKSDVLSPQFLYFGGRVLEGAEGFDQGAAISDVMDGALRYGVASESSYPYVVGQYAQRPTLDAYDDAILRKSAIVQPQAVQTLYELKHALASCMVVVIGFSVPSYFESAEMERTSFLPLPQTDDQFLGGHCVVCDGFDDRYATPWVTCANSWGDWGILHGWFKMDQRYFTDSRGLTGDMWALPNTGATP